MKQYKFILSGGGTGGHIYPAISIAERLLEVFPKSDITFVGSIGRMEMKTIPKYGYKIKGLFISGLKRNIFSFFLNQRQNCKKQLQQKRKFCYNQ